MRALFGLAAAGFILPQAVLAFDYAQDLAANGTYQSQGCWVDPQVLNGRSVFSSKPYQSQYMNIERCAAYCGDTANGGPYNYFGVKEGDKCYCGNEIYLDRGEADGSKCSIKCTGRSRSGETCGGTNRIELYTRAIGRTPVIANLPYVGTGLYTAGCYNFSDLASYVTFNTEMIVDSLNECAWQCKWRGSLGGSPNPDFFAFAVGETGVYEIANYYFGPSCTCFSPFDFSKLKQVPLSYCNRTCGHPDVYGDGGQICGGYGGNILLYSNQTKKDFDNASKATSRTSWSSSILAASTSRYSARSSKSASQLSASSSRSIRRSSVSLSQASASASRSTRRSSVDASKTSASLSRSTARSSGSLSKSSASSSRSSARSRVSASTSSASLAKSSIQQSLSASKSSYLSRYTSSSLSRQSAQADYTSRSRSSATSRSNAQSAYTSRSRSSATSRSSASSRLSSSRAAALSSQSAANAAAASSVTSASLSRSSFYSSQSYSNYLASSSRSSASAAGNRQARFGQVISVTTTIVIDTSSSDVPLTDTTSFDYYTTTSTMSYMITDSPTLEEASEN